MAARSKPAEAVTLTEFKARLNYLVPDLKQEPAIAVALSGGGDSMALTWLLAGWAAKHDIPLHALTVNHGLRAEAAAEAKQVGEWVADLGLIHKILKWSGKKPATRIQEEARKARYRLLTQYCHKHKIRYLFLGHHANDQVETILFRFAKGSGIDGLAGMTALQPHDKNLTLIRPLLNVTHERLLKTCKAAKMPWVEDISNVSDHYARIRLRKSMEVLQREGLTNDRILTIGKRFERAGKALSQVAENSWKLCCLKKNTDRIVISYGFFLQEPEEIAVRILQKAFKDLQPERIYPPRLENIEALVADIRSNSAFKAATLYGCIIKRQLKAGTITIATEDSQKA